MNEALTVIRPQPGPQEAFLATSADWAFYGGSAGSGKSWALLLEPLRHGHNPRFGGVIFRRTFPQISQEGGLWEKSEELYPLVGATPNKGNVRWTFPSGARMRFAHMQHETDMLNYQGGEIAYLAFDELTHFTERMVFYLVSRMRSTSGVRPYLRATMNPDPDSWVRKFITWWIGEDGYPILERSGVIRWFARVNDEIVWADSREQLLEKHPALESGDPISFTFIAARLKDNPALLERDPSYRARLRSLSPVERARLLGDEERGGNWDIRPAAGALFQRAWFPVLDAVPELKTAWRAWDFAATRPTTDNPNPDWTRGVKVGETPSGQLVVLDVVSVRDGPGEVDLLYERTALADGSGVLIHVPQDPGAAGVKAAQDLVRRTPRGHHVRSERVTGDKVTRARTASARAHAGLISVVKADWNDAFFAELEAFPDGQHDDIVDALADAVNALVGPKPTTAAAKQALSAW